MYHLIFMLLWWHLDHIRALSSQTQRNTFAARSIQSQSHNTISFSEIPILSENTGQPTTTSSSSDTNYHTSTIGERLKDGSSLIEIHNLVTPQECQFLVQSCLEVAQEYHDDDDDNTNKNSNNQDKKYPSRALDKPGLVRIPTIAAAKRAAMTKTPCADPLPESIDRRLEHILLRVTEYIDECIPSVSSTLFGTTDDGTENDGQSLTSLLLATTTMTNSSTNVDTLKFSSREPAINVYTPGGEFLAHKDAQALTVLLPLSRPTHQVDLLDDDTHQDGTIKDADDEKIRVVTSSSDDDPGFHGGGTALWSQNAPGHRVEAPSLILKPPAGTALLFGGCVTHAGVAVEAGTRVVFVASFSRCRLQHHMGVEQPQHQHQQQRDIYGDSM